MDTILENGIISTKEVAEGRAELRMKTSGEVDIDIEVDYGSSSGLPCCIIWLVNRRTGERQKMYSRTPS